MFTVHQKISRNSSSAAPAVVSVISFIFIMFMLTKGWLW